MSDSERELLSAAFDRQTNPAEQARVEETLRASDEARRELRDYEQLSGFLKELPRRELPEEFASRVLKLAEQRSLLPTPRPRPAPPRWLAPFVAAAAALVLVIGVTWMASAPQVPHVVIHTGLDRNALPQALPQAPAGEQENATPPMEAPVPLATTATVKPESPAVPAPAAAVSGSVFSESADRLQPGQPLTEKLGDVEVVTVYLVDSADGMQALQTAFARNQVVVTNTLDLKQQSQTRAALPADQSGSGTGAESEALLIVASNRQIEQSLEDLKKVSRVSSIVDEDAVEVAKLSADMQSFFLGEASVKKSGAGIRMQVDPREESVAALKPQAEVPVDAARSTNETRGALPGRQRRAMARELPREYQLETESTQTAAKRSPKEHTESAEEAKSSDLTKDRPSLRRLIVLVRRAPQPAAEAKP